ncbi:PAS domain-containing protein [Ochromonadaceae sp. CCMP2298]|nr:PAS domain-containing protein [Ochromonadaceae sp. CCMP2298]
MTESQRVERRERNREHAKRSRIRKRVLLETLQDQLAELRSQNVKLRRVVGEHIPEHAGRILSECTTEESSLLAHINSSGAGVVAPTKQTAKILMEPDFRLIHSLVTSQQNFVLSDPSLPDNPIVYASDGFCRMSGYKRQDILGRNCRFLQGPGTDQAAVDVIRQGVAEGRDISVCLLNYRADGSPFWNQFFLGALKDADGQVVNYVGVQCEVNTIPVNEIKDRVKRLPMPDDL